MKTRARDLLVGLVTIGAAAGMILLLALFGELKHVIQPQYRLTILTDHAAGLRRGSAVELNGVPIGSIDEVAIDGEDQAPVRVVVMIDERVSIAASAPYASGSLLGGSSVLELEVPAAEGPILARDGSARLDGPIRSRLVERITAELDARMEPIMQALTSFDEVGDSIVDVGRHLGALMEPQDQAALADGSATPNLRSSIALAYGVLDDTRAAIALAREWLGDDALRLGAGTAIERATTLIEQASGTLERFGALADHLEVETSAVAERLLPLSDELTATIEEVHRLTKQARSGQGTVGMLLNNPDLYLALTDAATRLDRAAREVQLLAEKIKAEGVSIGF